MKTIESLVAPIAATQHGVFTTAQAFRAGISKRRLERWVRTGRGQRLCRGVYLLGPLPQTIAARRSAAVLAAGPGAVLGGAAALEEHGVQARRSNDVVVLVGHSITQLGGVRYVRSRTLCDDDRTTCNGRPTSTIERALVDVAADRTEVQLCKLISEAAFHEVLDPTRLARTIERNRRRPGIGRLVAALHRYETGEHGVDSAGESRLERMLLHSGITGLRFNVELTIHGVRLRVDAFIESAGVVIELDPRHHGRPDRLREDELRTSLCRSVGLHVIRIDPASMAAGVREVARWVQGASTGSSRTVSLPTINA